MVANKEINIEVEHPSFGKGEILVVEYDTGDPLVSVQWDNGKHGCYWVDELDFLRRSD